MAGAGAAEARPLSRTLAVLKVLAFVGILAAMEIVGWVKTRDPLVIFYLCLTWLFGTARILNWPRPSWWGAAHVDQVKTQWGQRKFDRNYTPAETVNRLSEFVAARSFFVSSTYHENTERLCNNYSDGLTMRILGFGLTALFLCLRTDGHSLAIENVEGLLKLFGALMPAILTIVWDFSRFERQRFWNRELKAPQIVDLAE
jgi:hypothetical protein